MTEVKCFCKAWEKSMPQIIGAQQLADIHGMSYTGDKFVFCPWCTRLLEVESEYIPYHAPDMPSESAHTEGNA